MESHSPFLGADTHVSSELHEGVTLHQLCQRHAGDPDLLEKAISEELRRRVAQAIRQSDDSARLRPEFKHAVGFGALVGTVLTFLADKAPQRKNRRRDAWSRFSQNLDVALSSVRPAPEPVRAPQEHPALCTRCNRPLAVDLRSDLVLTALVETEDGYRHNVCPPEPRVQWSEPRMGYQYEIGYQLACQLRPLAESESEKAAIERLAQFRGDEADVRLVASMFNRAGEGANAAELLRLLPNGGDQ